MDERTTAILDGYTAVLTQFLKLLVKKRLLTADDVRKTVIAVLIHGVEHGAQPGFDAVPMHVLKLVDQWSDQTNGEATGQPESRQAKRLRRVR